MSGCRFGEMEAVWGSIPRIAAISSLTLAAGRMPPLPGFAPSVQVVFCGLFPVDSNDFADFGISSLDFLYAKSLFQKICGYKIEKVIQIITVEENFLKHFEFHRHFAVFPEVSDDYFESELE